MAVLFAWLVHGYTALGLVCAAGMAVLIVRGDDGSVRLAFLLMMIATAIDASDGWLARRARVKEVLPDFDGSALDNLIDFHTYTSLPLLLIWRAAILPDEIAGLLLVPLLASAYGFSKVDAKTDAGFLGFPSYWNIVAFYLFVLRPATAVSVTIVLVFAALTFVRTPYLYATRGGPFAGAMNAGAVLWFVLLGVGLFGSPAVARVAVMASLLYPAAYLGISAYITVRWRRTRTLPIDGTITR